MIFVNVSLPRSTSRTLHRFQPFVVPCKPLSLNHSGLISFSTVPCHFSTPSGAYWFEPQQQLSNLECSLFVSHSRSMTRAQRAPKRTTTPTSAAFSPTEIIPSNAVSPSLPVPAIPKPLFLSSPFVEAALVKGNFKTIVMLPKYVDIMEWVAMNSTCSSPRTYLRNS